MKEKGIFKVVSHTPPRHLDDMLAVALIKAIYPEAGIEWVHPQDSNKLEEYRKRKDVILVDVGGEYNPEMFNFDHHQDKEICCSFLLCWKAFEDKVKDKLKGLFLLDENFDILKYKWVRFLDEVDRKGFSETAKKYGVKPNRSMAMLQKIILLSAEKEDFYEEKSRKSVFKVFIEVVKKYGSDESFDRFMGNFYSQLDNYGFLEEGKKKIKEEERNYKRKLEKVLFLNIIRENGGVVYVAFSEESLSPFHARFFSETGVDLLIERNAMNGKHTSLIKNTSSEVGREIDLSVIYPEIERVFVHKAGFLEVIDCPIEELDINLLLRDSNYRFENTDKLNKSGRPRIKPK